MREAGMKMTALVARVLIDKTKTLLDLGDPEMVKRRRQDAARRDRAGVNWAERAAAGGHLNCEGQAPLHSHYWSNGRRYVNL